MLLLTRKCTGNVTVDLDDLLDAGGFHQRTRDPLLHGEDDSLAGLDADGGAAELDGLDGVLHLEQPPLGGEGVGPAVILGSVEEHGHGVCK